MVTGFIIFGSLLSMVSSAAATTNTGRLSKLLQPEIQAEYTLNQRDVQRQMDFRLDQGGSTYGEYQVLGIPYSARTSYNYFDSFLIGLNLDYFFKGSNQCISKVVFTADDFVYLDNNYTLTQTTNDSSWFGPVLNFTGLLARNMDNVLPNCFKSYVNAKVYAVTQFEQFNNSIGQVLLSFLFNQMGNALQFVTKFNNIELNQQTQNYAGAWLEFGSIVHIIFDFQPLSLASRGTIYDLMATFLVDNKILDNEEQAHKAIEYLIDHIDKKMENLSRAFDQFFTIKEKDVQVPEVKKQLKTQAFTGDSTLPLLKGFGNGIADVFAKGGIEDRCRMNISATYNTTMSLFVDWHYTLPDDNEAFFDDIASYMTYPYGLTYNCFYSVDNLFFAADSVNDTSIAGKLVLINQPITNILFNAGYLYTDVTNYLSLDDTDPDYWQTAGGYLGDFFIRFLWRTPFSSTFQFTTTKDCDARKATCKS